MLQSRFKAKLVLVGGLTTPEQEAGLNVLVAPFFRGPSGLPGASGVEFSDDPGNMAGLGSDNKLYVAPQLGSTNW